MRSARTRLSLLAGDCAGQLSRLAGRGSGQVIAGRVALAGDPRLLTRLAAGRRVFAVSGTNGKTTTTRLLAAALALRGPVASNASGANLPAGLVTALHRSSAPTAVLEVDEGYLPRVIAQTAPRGVVLLNLSRDQLDRTGEVHKLARSWRESLRGTPVHVVANVDDPLVAWAAGTAGQVSWVSAGQAWQHDSWCCPQCGGPLSRDGLRWRCGGCPLRRPAPTWRLHGEDAVLPSEVSRPMRLALPGAANRGNALLALATAATLGDVQPAAALAAMRDVTAVAGRYAVHDVDGRIVRVLLAKNPAGWLATFDLLDGATTPAVLALNARGADGTDTSWLWDVDVERLAPRRIVVCGERAIDLAVRLAEAELPFEVADSVQHAVAMLPAGPVDVVANYTAFRTLRAHLDAA